MYFPTVSRSVDAQKVHEAGVPLDVFPLHVDERRHALIKGEERGTGLASFTCKR
jgi:hypothetical protein